MNINQKLKQLFPSQLVIISTYLIIVPIIRLIFEEITGSSQPIDSTITNRIAFIALPFLFISCIVNKKKIGLIALLPAVYYLNFLPEDILYYRYFLLLFTTLSFLYTVFIGHIRAISFLFLIAYSSFIFQWYEAASISIVFIFARFIALALSHNVTVFTTLGFKKSFLYLGKSFLYWSPLLLLIVPINIFQSSINNKVASEIYRYCPVDTVQYHLLKELPDTLIADFEANSNITSVIFLDNAKNIRNRNSRTDYPFSLPIVKTVRVQTDELTYKNLNSKQEAFVNVFLQGKNITEFHKMASSKIIKLRKEFLNLKEKNKGLRKGGLFQHIFNKVHIDKNNIRLKKIEKDINFINNIIKIFKEKSPRISELKKQLISQRLNRYKTLPKNPAYNNIDLSIAEKQDTLKYEVLVQAFSGNEDGIQEIRNINFNDMITSGSMLDSTYNLVKWNLLTSITNIEKSDTTIALVLKDVSLPKPSISSEDLQCNIEVSIMHLFVNFTNKLIVRIKEEAASIDFSQMDGLSGDLSQNIHEAKEKGNEIIHAQKKSVFKQINDHENSTLATVDKEINAIFPEPLLKTESAKFYQIKKLIVNAIKRNVNKRYKEEKRRLKNKIDHKIKSIYADVRQEVDHAFLGIEQQYALAISSFQVQNIETPDLSAVNFDIPTLIENNIKSSTGQMFESTIEAIRVSFTILFFYGLLGTLSFAFLIIQTYMYVFARVTISEKNRVFATLNTGLKELPQGNIKTFGDTYTIEANDKEIYYASRAFEPSGIPPKFIVPYPKIAIFPRIKSQLYSMNQIKMRNHSPVQFRAIGSCEFVEWTIAEGEEVVFNYNNLVALTSTVKLKSVVNLRVTTLILGKLFHKVAVGPGKIILMTKGRPIISGEESANTSLAQNRILAWNAGTRFDIDSELGLVDIYLSGFYLRKMYSDLIIIDADAKGKASSGLIQYVKGLIWPF